MPGRAGRRGTFGRRPREYPGSARVRGGAVVADVAYVLLTVALFALLSLAVRAVERL
ncbi:hypothetical protein ODJ79_45530 [Actinoplanes sp. KI2]|uniref:hypothetical protein n=1 Tax=Actinoplanes sp. KI2 TaxID=2983315 RepID=UPI0021D5CC6F|nr:hypothetical protein [Actinoplanes sp. KI2]MCU7731020.1 hypothetical protein [Actinoplanes sp. KI2]